MEEKIQELIDSIESSKYEETIRLESIDANSSILRTKLKVPIKLNPNRHYRAGLRYFTVYNNLVNINETNNVFRYSIDNGTSWKTISLLTGAYEIVQIDEEIKRQMKLNKDYDLTNESYYIDIIPKAEINRIVLHITNDTFKLDRNVNNTITSFFGFTNNETALSKGYHIAENQAMISKVFTIDFECNIIQGGIVNGIEKQIIYDIPSFTVPINSKIIEQPQIINYFPLNTTLLNEITIRILDQDGNLIYIPGERKFASLKIIQV